MEGREAASHSSYTHIQVGFCRNEDFQRLYLAPPNSQTSATARVAMYPTLSG